MAAIDVLPDDVLLAIFDFCVVEIGFQHFYIFGDRETKRELEWWQSPVHVCRRWRSLVFGSPRRLNLQLFCIPETSARKTLDDVWPALPLLINGNFSETSVDNVVALLEHSDRICQITVTCHTTSEFETVFAAMQVPFPELTVLALGSPNKPVSALLPDSFLGGSAPALRFLNLFGIPYPRLPNLLLSATQLIALTLYDIPHSVYISPEAMVTCLSALTNLQQLVLGFESPQSCPDQETQRPSPPTRTFLPTLGSLVFKGVNEYLEELVARIDAPRFCLLSTTFFNDIDFDTSELTQFISRTSLGGAYDEVRLTFDSLSAMVGLQSRPVQSSQSMIEAQILCQVPNWQLSFLAQICNLPLRLLLKMEYLYIYENLYSQHPQLNWEDDIDFTEWLELLLPFTAVKNLYLSKQFAPRIAPALQELTGDRTTEVLPSLQNIFLEGFLPSEPVQEGIRQFISARQLINRPVVISVWERDSEQEGFIGPRFQAGKVVEG